MMNGMQPRGFTLVETLVAITIIVTAIVGPMYAVQQAMGASMNARDQLIASSLAQEGIEYVRSVRDNNYLYTLKTGNARSWFYGLDATGGTNCMTADCIVDPTQGTASRTITPLSLTGGLYNQSGAPELSNFTRRVRLSSVSANEMLVTVTVSWNWKGQARSVVLTDHLYDWL